MAMHGVCDGLHSSLVSVKASDGEHLTSQAVCRSHHVSRSHRENIRGFGCGTRSFRSREAWGSTSSYRVERYSRVAIHARRQAANLDHQLARIAGSAAGLTSASRLLRITAGSLGDSDHGEFLRHSWVDTDSVVKVCFGRSAFHRHSKSLGHLTGTRAADMKANNTLMVQLIANELGVASIVTAVRQSPFERFEVGMVDLNVIFAVQLDGVLFCEADSAVLQRCVNSGRHVGVVHLHGLAAIQPVCQELTRLDGDRRELGGGRRRSEGITIDNVTDRIDVGHVGSLVVDRDLAIFGEDHASFLYSNVRGAHIASDGEQHCIILCGGLCAVGVLPYDLLRAGWKSRDCGGHRTLGEVDAMLLHVRLADARHLLIEASQRNRPHHHCGLVSEALDEAGTFQRNVRSSNHQGAARRRLHREHVVRGDTVLLGARNVWVPWAPARCDHKCICGDLCLLAFLIDSENSVWV
mmetsp:Transcript_22137/g.67169  ORF Transcript_22137/g.67169 Transcript_22137/m.67169 type:complete len:466 (-) Transcript_22137:551-1948(-)